MAVSKKKSALGNNPLSPPPTSQGIFSPTATEPHKPDSTIKKKESRKKQPAFLDPTLTAADKDRVNLRLPVELNDWLDDLLKQGKRKHGQKIPKEIWMQAALELFRAMPLDWLEVETEDDLRAALQTLLASINNQE